MKFKNKTALHGKPVIILFPIKDAFFQEVIATFVSGYDMPFEGWNIDIYIV